MATCNSCGRMNIRKRKDGRKKCPRCGFLPLGSRYDRAGNMIKAVAICVDKIIHTLPPPNRHHHVIAMMDEKHGNLLLAHGEQGFITDTGEFLDRILAGEHALACGQITSLEHPPKLFSEDLW